jgi:hypothetical protein
MARIASIGLLLLLAGCGLPFVQKTGLPTPEIGDREPPGTLPGVTAGLASKVVNAKEAPATLIAADQSSCTVSERRFRDTILGAKVLCNWR